MVAEVSARLAGGADLGVVLPSVAEAVRDGIGAAACSIWRTGDRNAGGWTALAHAGAGAIAPAPGADPSVAGDGGAWATLPIAAGDRRVGALAVARAAPLSDEERMALGTVANLLATAIVAADETRRFAEEVASGTRELEAQHRFIERIVDSLPVGLYVVDREYRVHAWNRKRETGTQGVLREEALGRTIFELLRRQPADVLREEFDLVFRTGEMTQFEMESSAFGEPRTFRVSKIPMRIHDADVTHVITIGEDITDWKRAQERAAQAQKLAALGQLSAGVMHEINNPLATIGACAESMALQLQEGSVPDPLREAFAEYCQIIDHEVHRSKRIVDGLLDFSRPKAAERGAVDVREVVDQTLFLLKHHARFRGVRVDASSAPGTPPIVHGNREQLVQVLMALLLNAADAMRGRGTVRVRTTDASGGREVVIAVEDEGEGIPASAIAKLFEPFYTTKSPGRGTGLGLSICYGIVADHGGRIEVESTVGVGSTFRVRLPAEGRGAA
ncbi:MAG TPA: ATP-binding protein [Gemmatimonadaceae bacterium]